jgi:hypothetical protein
MATIVNNAPRVIRVRIPAAGSDVLAAPHQGHSVTRRLIRALQCVQRSNGLLTAAAPSD